MAAISPSSSFLSDQLDRIRAAAEWGAVVDLACGRGHHALALARAGLPVIGVDRNREFLARLRTTAERERVAVGTVRADFESRSEIPIRTQGCGAVLIFRYLHRPLTPAITRVLAPGGLLVYETFTAAQVEFGYGPRNPDYLLEPGELPELFPELEILEHWEGVRVEPRPAAVAQLVAQKR